MKVFRISTPLSISSHGPLKLVIQLFRFYFALGKSSPNDHRLLVPLNYIPRTHTNISWSWAAAKKKRRIEEEEAGDFVSKASAVKERKKKALRTL